MKGFAFAQIAFSAVALIGVAASASAAKICIDPGHGGTDPGAVSSGQTEAGNVLNTAAKFKTWLDTDTTDTGGGGTWTVIRTRTTDATVSLSARCVYANDNSADRFMSIHNNSFSDASANGMETFSYTTSSANSQDIRNKVQEEGIAMWPLTNRGPKTAALYVLGNTDMPAELHELGFISNTTDRGYVGNATHQDNIMKSSLWALQRHYGLAEYTPTTAIIVTQDNTAPNFTASANWTTSTSTAGYVGANYHTRATASVSDAAQWSATLPSAGNYKVEAWWTAGANRAASAPYIVDANTGSTTVNKNQQANGGSWQNLGIFAFNTGSNTVRLSCWTGAGFFVVADAVRFTKQ